MSNQTNDTSIRGVKVVLYSTSDQAYRLRVTNSSSSCVVLPKGGWACYDLQLFDERGNLLTNWQKFSETRCLPKPNDKDLIHVQPGSVVEIELEPPIQDLFPDEIKRSAVRAICVASPYYSQYVATLKVKHMTCKAFPFGMSTSLQRSGVDPKVWK